MKATDTPPTGTPGSEETMRYRRFTCLACGLPLTGRAVYLCYACCPEPTAPPPLIRTRYEFAGSGEHVIPRGATGRLDYHGHAYTFDLPPDDDGCTPFVAVDFVRRHAEMFEPVKS